MNVDFQLPAWVGADWTLGAIFVVLIGLVAMGFYWVRAGEDDRENDRGVRVRPNPPVDEHLRKLQMELSELRSQADRRMRGLEQRVDALQRLAEARESLAPQAVHSPIQPPHRASDVDSRLPQMRPPLRGFGNSALPGEPPYDRPPERPPQPLPPRRDPMQDARAATLQAWRDVWKPGLDLQRFAGLLRAVPGFSGVQEKDRMAWVELGVDSRAEVVILPIYFEAFINERYYEVPGGSRDAFIEAVQRPAVLAHGQSEPTRGLAVTNIAGA